MSGKHRSPDQKRPPGMFTGFGTLLLSLTGMFIALAVGSMVALAGRAGGIVGAGLVALFLVSIIVFMVELLRRPEMVNCELGADDEAHASAAESEGDYSIYPGSDDGREYDERDYYDERQPERYSYPEQAIIHFEPIWSLTTVPIRVTRHEPQDQQQYQAKHRQSAYGPDEAIA